eukprot:UN10831
MLKYGLTKMPDSWNAPAEGEVVEFNQTDFNEKTKYLSMVNKRTHKEINPLEMIRQARSLKEKDQRKQSKIDDFNKRRNEKKVIQRWFQKHQEKKLKQRTLPDNVNVKQAKISAYSKRDPGTPTLSPSSNSKSRKTFA